MDGVYRDGRKRGLEEDDGGDLNKRQHRNRETEAGSHVHHDDDFHHGARQMDSDQHGRSFADQPWGGPNRGRGRFGWQEGRGRGGYVPNGMTVPRHLMAPGRGPMQHDRGGRGGGRWAGRGAGTSMPEGAGMPGGHFALPLPPQHEDSRDERGMPGPPGPMQEDGFQGQFGRGQGPFLGRGRGWGRGAPGGFRRQGGPPLDPAVLERRRQSTAASVQRQLAHVLVSEDLAGDKGFTHYQRAVSIASPEQQPENGKALWAEDRVKQCYMSSALPAVDNHAGGCDYDALDAFELCLNEYQAIPLEIVSLEASKYGSFLAPRLLFGGMQVKRENS